MTKNRFSLWTPRYETIKFGTDTPDYQGLEADVLINPTGDILQRYFGGMQEALRAGASAENLEDNPQIKGYYESITELIKEIRLGTNKVNLKTVADVRAFEKHNDPRLVALVLRKLFDKRTEEFENLKNVLNAS